MGISRVLVVSVLCLWWTTIGFCQEGKINPLKPLHPDFSGNWVIGKAESKVSYKSPLAKTEMTLVIFHHEPEIKVTRRAVIGNEEREHEFFYYTDGRSERIPALTAGGINRCKTKWKKSKLVSKCTAQISYTLYGREKSIEQEFTEQWELSSDGQTLTQKSSFSPPINTSDAFQNAPPEIRAGVEREITISTILHPRQEIKTFKRVP